METQNDYDREVFNGDLGTVVRIDEEEGALIAELRWPGGDLSVRRTRHPGACLRDHDPQEPGLGVPGCGHPGHHAALHDAGAQSCLHGRDAGQAAGRHHRPEEGARDRGQGWADEAALDEAAGVALAWTCALIVAERAAMRVLMAFDRPHARNIWIGQERSRVPVLIAFSFALPLGAGALTFWQSAN